MRTLIALVLTLAITGPLAFAGPAHPNLNVSCKHPFKVLQHPTYQKDVGDMIRSAFAQSSANIVVNCTSCYRSVKEQEDTCYSICKNRNGCQNPPRCARPGGSQHQKEHMAVCDLSKIPGNTKDVCEKLKQLCFERFGGKCGIGGYGGGGFHFGVGDTRFTAWNQCGSLVGNDKEAQRLSQEYAQAEYNLYDDFLKIFINTGVPVFQQIIENNKTPAAPPAKQQ